MLRPLKRGFLFLLFLVISLIPNQSDSSAWVRNEGEGLFFYNLYYSEFRQFYTNGGEKQSQDSFYKTEFKPYFEYGLTNEITLGYSPSLQAINTSGRFGVDSNYGLQFMEFYFKRHLFEYETYIANFETIFEAPGFYSERVTPTFGKKDYFIQPRVNLGKSWQFNEALGGFLQLGGGIKNRFYDYFGDDSGSAMKLDATIGFNITDRYQYFVRYDSTRSLTGYNSQLNVLDRFGFDLDKIEISSVTHYTTHSIEIGYITDLSGRNTGSGETVKFSIWQNF